MSAESCLALLLDAPLQSWGHASRFERRTTALHPTRSAIFGVIAAALGIDKQAEDEAEQLSRFSSVRLDLITLPKLDARRQGLPILRLVDYHTVLGTRKASGKIDKNAVQTYRHYLLDARFGALLEGQEELLREIATALSNPRWGVWLGRKSCLPASPILASQPTSRPEAWRTLLQRAGYTGDEPETDFDRVVETNPATPGADAIEDLPVGYGKPIGQRHRTRWVLRKPRERHADL